MLPRNNLGVVDLESPQNDGMEMTEHDLRFLDSPELAQALQQEAEQAKQASLQEHYLTELLRRWRAWAEKQAAEVGFAVQEDDTDERLRAKVEYGILLVRFDGSGDDAAWRALTALREQFDLDRAPRIVAGGSG